MQRWGTKKDVNMSRMRPNPQVKRLRTLLENPRVNWFPHYMALDVLVAKEAVRVNFAYKLGEVVEMRV